MTEIQLNRQKADYLKYIFILFTVLSNNSSLVTSEPELIITEQITTCTQNVQGAILFQFTSNKFSSDSTVEGKRALDHLIYN